MYRSHILGLAGSFSQRQLAELKRCLPLNFVDYIEEDVKVMLMLLPLGCPHEQLLAKQHVCLSESESGWVFGSTNDW